MTPLLLPELEKIFTRLFFISFLQFEELMETGSLYLGPLHCSFFNLLFWTICKSPVTATGFEPTSIHWFEHTV